MKYLCGNDHQFINNIEFITLSFLNDDSDHYSYRIKDNMLMQQGIKHLNFMFKKKTIGQRQ